MLTLTILDLCVYLWPLEELEEARSSLQAAEDKYNKIVKTVKVARNRIQTLTTEKDKVCAATLLVKQFKNWL